MTEEQKFDNETQAEEQAPAGEQSPGSEFVGELQSLGLQLATAVKSLWESEDSRKLRQEIGDGFDELGRQLSDAVQTAQESDTAKQLGEQVRETVDKARESDLTDKLEQSLTQGLHELNTQLSKMVGSMESKGADAEEEPAAAEDEEE